MRCFRTLLAALAGTLTLAAHAQTGSFTQALQTPPGGAPKTVTVDIVANRTAGTPRADYRVAVRLRHEPGWHTYWRFAGDTGYAPEVEWRLPRRWSAEPLGWPLPQKHKTGTLTNFVYSGEVLLPYKLDIPWGTPYGTSGTIKAKVEWLACKDVCIPGEAEVSFRVPVDVASKPSEHARLFDDARRSIPEHVSTEHIAATLEGDRLQVDFAPLAGKIDRTIEFFPLSEGVVDFKDLDRMHVSDKGVSLYLKMHKEWVEQHAGKPDAVLDGVFVADGGPLKGGWAIHTTVPVKSGTVALPWVSVKPAPKAAPVAVSEPPPAEPLGQSTALLFAFLGGLILNLMPCVFPVLSLKILQLVDSTRRQGSLASHGIAFTAGILASMLALSCLLMVLRSLGWAIGWGFQLQTPWVVSVLALLFVSLALNLFGLFEFTAASHLADSRAVKSLPTTGPAGSFFTGVLAVIVASPCTAPFMGAALGYAILQSNAESIFIFLALGVGMALPWLLLTLVPAWTRFLPRPGAWMVTFKRIMALPMLAAALWLIWVLSRQVNFFGICTLLLAMGAVSAFLWALGREQYGRGQSKILKAVTALVSAGCVAVLAMGTFDRATAGNSNEGAWQAWSEEAVSAQIAKGHPVLIDFTAAWCVTCQFNKAAALRTDAVAAKMKDLGYVSFEADWTNRDARITKMLNKFGRTGVPLYLIYAPDGRVTVLPELLTEAVLLEALDKHARK